MSDKNALFPIVQSVIDFETLLLQAREALDDYAHVSWSNTDEHDPGITLLQAMCYNVSDLAYRSSLPITDVLTPAPSQQIPGDGLFPARFGPHQVLTCGAITVDDYRRALLDLHSGSQAGGFYFDNVQLVQEPLSARYSYWYNLDVREYSFTEPDMPGKRKLTLRGNYHLYLQPSRNTELDHRQAQSALDIFLRDHRNLCEAVSHIVWIKPADVTVRAVIELKDEVDTTTSIAAVLAKIYTVLEQHITPPVSHYSTQQLQALGLTSEQIYEGPELQHGWIPQLPVELDYTQSVKVNLARAVNRLLEIEEIGSIRSLSVDEGDSAWEWTTLAGYYPRLWGADPLGTLAGGGVVQLISHGLNITTSAAEIQQHLTTPPLIHNPQVILPYAQWRAPARYYPLTEQIPPCYGLLSPPATPAEQQLHEFLLPFEQLLANGCQQLSMLPQLLSFNRDMQGVTWGVQWPFVQASVSDDVFKQCSADLKAYLLNYSRDIQQELACVDYLLGYFNEKVAQQDFLIDPVQFLTTQQGYLGRVAQLAYQRTNFRVEQVSALQQRIAARLGVGGEGVFNGQTPLDRLPFYIVEHRALLPVIPEAAYDLPQMPLRVKEEDIEGTQYLTLILPSTSVAPLHIGQVVDLKVVEGALELTIRALMIDRINSTINAQQQPEQRFSIRVMSNVQLQRNLPRVTNPANVVTWRNSGVWLEDMYYPVVYAQDQSGLNGSNEKRLVSSPQSPYPAMVAQGDVLVFESSRAAFTGRALNDKGFYLKAEVKYIDHIASTLVIQRLEGNEFPAADKLQQYFWYFDSTTTSIEDRFSFLVSAVFSRDLLTQVTSDPYSADSWVVNTILEELPAHINLLVHWLPHDQYLNFAGTYKTWQDSGAPLGDASYSLLRMLTVGCLPSSLTGIGAMVIATEAQRDQVVGAGTDWNRQVIIDNELFFIPLNAGDVDGEALSA